MFIPGSVMSIVTFPGVIVHELAHQLFCRYYRVAVFQVCYFRRGNPAGFVIHEPVDSVVPQIMISVGPFFLNSILGAFIAMPGAAAVLEFSSSNPLDYLLTWLGLSIAMHAFPSRGDANSLWEGVKKASAVKRLLVFPIVALIYVGSIGSFIWLDLLYGMAITIFVPKMLLSAIF